MRPRFTLYGNFESGNAYKAALTLTLTGASYEYAHVPIFAGGTRTAEFKAKLNRFGEVPVLVDTARDDKTLSQSGAVLWYVAREMASPLGAPAGSDDELRILEWSMFDNHRILPGVARTRFLKRFAKEPAPALVAATEGYAVAALDILEHELTSKDWLVGDRFTIADIQCSPYVFLLDETGLDRNRWPHLVAWTQRIAAQPGFVPQYELLPRE